MAQPPDTAIEASPEEAESIRGAVRGITSVNVPYGTYRPAVPADAPALFRLLSDIRVSGPLYTVPKPVTRYWVEQWIDSHAREAMQGVGLLMLAHKKLMS